MKFLLLNVFTHDDQGGNRLAVVFPAKSIPDSQMQEITLNFGFSVTVFISPKQELRIFSPWGELPFAGHPTIGAAWAIQANTKKTIFTMQTLKGEVHANTYQQAARIKFPGEVALSEFNGQVENVLKQINLTIDQIEPKHIRLANSGPHFLIIPVKDRAALSAAVTLTQLEGPGRPYLVYRESPGVFHVRMFSPALKHGEDAATGSAACALAGYLREVHKEDRGAVSIFQGKEIQRPSNIRLEWTKSSIFIEGPVLKWGEGHLANQE